MKKRTPVPAYMLLLSLSNKLVLFCSHSKTPCIKEGANNSSSSNMALLMYLLIIYYMYSTTMSEEWGRGSQVRDGITDWGRTAR